MSALTEAKARYGGYKDAASLHATRTLGPILGIDVRLLRWSNKTREALEDQWGGVARAPEAHWDWREVFRSYSEPSSFDMALWTSDGRLCALGLATKNQTAITFRFAEGDPRPDCPYRGKRLPVLLEAVVFYGQILGLEQVRIEPANSTLETLYKSLYGFSLETPKKGRSFLWREI